MRTSAAAAAALVVTVLGSVMATSAWGGNCLPPTEAGSWEYHDGTAGVDSCDGDTDPSQVEYFRLYGSNDAANAGGSVYGYWDEIHGGDGTDTLRGQDGIDEIWGEGLGDYLYGGNGDDQLHGAVWQDELHGGDGNDILEGGDSADILVGDEKQDRLEDTCCGGLAEKDKACGGLEVDRIYFMDGDEEDSVYDQYGTDIVSKDPYDAPVYSLQCPW